MFDLLSIALFNSFLGVLNYTENEKETKRQADILNKINYLVARAKENEQSDNNT
jgi:hypothetical protein